ncbi:hypothetical protein GCM10010232_28980 [Streptomyces amakusaensis]
MITIIQTSSIKCTRVTDRSMAASVFSLGFSASLNGTGLSAVVPGALAEMSRLLPPNGFPVRTGGERPTKALGAGEAAAAEARTYAFAAAGAKNQKHNQHHTKWAFRGLEPWSDPA